MPTTLDDLNKTITDLRDVIASNTNKTGALDKSTLDLDSMTQVFKTVLNDWNATNTGEAIRKGEKSSAVSHKFGPLGEGAGDEIVTSGKFAGRKIEELAFVDYLLSKAVAAGQQDVKPPSKELRGIVSKALTATGAGTGDEYVPTGMAATLWNDFFLASRVGSQFANFDQPTDPFDWPLSWGPITFRKGTQNTATTATDMATAKSTFTSTEMVAEVDFAYNLEEDAIIAVMPTLREEIARGGGDYIDKFIMNADSTNAATGNINLDDADPDDDSYYLSAGQDGLRHQIIVDNTSQATDINTTLTDALLREAWAKMGKYGTDVGRLVMFADPKTYLVSLMGLTNVVTWDKFGPQATVLTGQLGAWSGIPIVPTSSIALAEDDGKLSTTGANNDEGTVLIAHRDFWKVGYKRKLMLEVARDIQKRQVMMVASFRIAIGTRGTRSTNTHTAGAFGITY